MKKTAILLALSCLASWVCAAQTNQHYTVSYTPSTSAFTGSTNTTMSPDGYNWYVTTNVTLPFNQWTFVGSNPATFIAPGNPNYVATTSFGFNVTMNPPIFVSNTYSNGLGTSPFSNPGGLQSYPVAAVTKSISSP